MKSKFFILSAVITSCIFSIVSNQSTADQRRYDQQSYSNGSAVTNPNMPTAPSNHYHKHPCYPAGKCNGDPNLIGREYQGSSAVQNSKPLQIESTEKFVGTVQSVNRVALPDQTQIQMVLATDQGNVLVILGPASYIDQQKIKFVAGDKVTVNGYRVRANNTEVINAASIQKNGNTLKLLDEKRQPLYGYGYNR